MSVDTLLQEIDKPKMPSPEKLYAEAHAAGMAAGNALQPVPMLVEQHASPLDDNSPVVKQWVCNGGVCGFAWVKIKPARGKFVSFCKKHDIGYVSDYGGYEIWVSQFGQSIEKKEAYAHAFAAVLKKYGIKAYGQSRMD